MNKTQLLALYDEDQRRTVEYPNMRREVGPHVVRHINTISSGEGSVIHTELSATNADDVIREQIRVFEAIGQDFEWKLYDHDAPPDLRQRLAAHGFVLEEVEAIMVLDLQEAPARMWQPVHNNLRRIAAPEQLSQVLNIESQVWSEDFSSLGDYLTEALSNYPDQMSVYVAYINEMPASTAWIYFPKHSQFASLWGGSTLPDFRRQGLYTDLLTARAQEARARQVRYLTVDASPMSRPILEKYGFELMDYSYPCKWKLRSRKTRGAV